MSRTLVLLIALLTLICPLARAELPTSLSVIPTDGWGAPTALQFHAPWPAQRHTDVELGVELSGAQVRVHAADTTPYRLAMQLETSLSLQDEGPHLDLTDWQHCTSEWVLLTAEAEGRFSMPEFPSILAPDCFPEINPAELEAVVQQRGGQAWLNILRLSPLEPISISYSQVRLRLEQWQQDHWQVITVIHLHLPMGC